MNKRLLTILIFLTLILLASSFGIKNFILNHSKKLVSEIDAKNTNVLYEKAMDAYSKKDYQRAIGFFEALMERSSDKEITEESFINLTKSYNAKGDYIGAKRTLERFLTKFPNSKSIAQVKNDIEDTNVNMLLSDVITDESFKYEIKPGDTLVEIASKFNTTVELIKISNGLKSDLILPGKFLKINKVKFKILVDKSENMLTLRKNSGEIIKTYAVATGENLNTPTGTFKIEEKLISPVWYKVGAIVKPDSTDYELGSRWMGLSIAGYGIHGTNDVASIGKHITKGCVRMRNKDVEELYAIVPSGTEVTIVE